MNFEQEIKTLLFSRNFLIHIKTYEEERLEYILSSISHKYFNHTIYIWDFIEGYNNYPNYIGKAKRNPLEALNIIYKNSNKTPNIFFLKILKTS